MGVVSWMVGTADAFLVDAAESQFGAVASNTGTIVLLMVTLSLIGVCINMAFQFRSMDGASFFWYLIKLTLIGLFAFNWANFNAVAGIRYGVNTGSNTVTATLPATPTTGDAIFFADAGGNYATNNLTIGRNGNTIMGLAQDMTVSNNNQSVGLFYSGTTWRIY